MATTFTWVTTGHMADTAGKQCVSIVEYICKGVDGSAKSKQRGQVILDRPSDADMEDRATFATETKLITAVKAKLGATEVTRIETVVNRGVQDQVVPTETWHYST